MFFPVFPTFSSSFSRVPHSFRGFSRRLFPLCFLGLRIVLSRVPSSCLVAGLGRAAAKGGERTATAGGAETASPGMLVGIILRVLSQSYPRVNFYMLTEIFITHFEWKLVFQAR